jgi:Tetratricopeptide repeat
MSQTRIVVRRSVLARVVVGGLATLLPVAFVIAPTATFAADTPTQTTVPGGAAPATNPPIANPAPGGNPATAATTAPATPTTPAATTPPAAATTAAPKAGQPTPTAAAASTATPAAMMQSGRDAVAKKDWPTAVAMFTKVTEAEPKNADAWNMLGYSTRKSGNAKAAIGLYNKALTINPNHLGALEYQGEAFVELKQIPKAKANLARIKKICGTTCEQYVDLAKFIGAKK